MTAEETPVRVYDGMSLQSLLPHRYPFLLVDRIAVIEPGQHVRGLKQLTIGEWWTDGGLTSLPFSLLLEALAQTSGALIPDLGAGAADAIAYFMAAEHVRIRGSARVGDELRFDIRLKAWRRGICRTVGTAKVDGREVMRAEIVTVVRAA